MPQERRSSVGASCTIPPGDEGASPRRCRSHQDGLPFEGRRTHVADRGMSAALVIQLDNATLIVLSFAKFVIRGIHGSVNLSPCTRH